MPRQPNRLWGGVLPLALLLCVALAVAVHAVRFKMRYPKMEPEVHDTTQNAERGYTWFTDRRHSFQPIVDSGPPHRCEIVAAEVRPHKADDAGAGAGGGEDGGGGEGGGDAGGGGGDDGGGGGGGDGEALFVEFATQLQAKLRDDDEGGSGGGEGEGGDGGDGKEDMSTLLGALHHVGHFTELRGAFADGEKGARAWLKHPKRLEKKHPGKHFWSCIDSRATYAVLGTPGGDVGEFILALGAAELVNPKHKYTLEEVNQLFQEFMYRMQAFGKHHLYLHTDEAAEKSLAAAAGAKNAKRPATAEERNALIDACVAPENIGCQHLKAMISDSGSYKIRKELVEYVLKVYHSVYYDTFNPLHTHLLYVTLKGEAAKTPGFKVFTPHVCHRHEAPVLVPNTAGDDADGGRYAKRGKDDGKPKARPGSKGWVHHHRHVKYWRNVLGAFLVLHDTHLTMPEIANRQDWLAAQHDTKIEGVYGGPTYDLIFA